MTGRIFDETISCPACKGHEFELSTEVGSRGNAAEQGLFCTYCRQWTTFRPRPPGLHLTQPKPAIMGGAGLSPGDDPAAIGEQGPTDIRVWAWLLAKLLEEAKQVLADADAHRCGGEPLPDVYDHATTWLQRFYASEHGAPPQALIPALENAAKGGV